MSSIDSYRNLGSHYEMKIVQALLAELSHPEQDVDIIHVAGTNGKGSTISYLANSFIQNKIDLITFTSPQVRRYLDRFSFNGKAVEQDVFDQAEAIVLQAADQLASRYDRHATVFEMELAIAFILAKILGARLFIMETGLGGRLDATNAVECPLATVFTSISLDHKDELGDNITAVTKEKAGIIKSGVPIFSSVQLPEAEKILRDCASAENTSIKFLSAADIQVFEDSLETQNFFYDRHNYSIHMPGKQQILNAALAVMVLRNLPAPYNLTPEIIAEGLARTNWPGSFELIAHNPDIILDGAHNQDAVTVLGENLRRYDCRGKCYGILHVFEDKDIVGILKGVTQLFDKIWLPQMNYSRSTPAEKLQLLCQKYLKNTECIVATISGGCCDRSKKEAEAEDTIVVFGSLSHLESARKALIEIDEVVII